MFKMFKESKEVRDALLNKARDINERGGMCINNLRNFIDPMQPVHVYREGKLYKSCRIAELFTHLEHRELCTEQIDVIGAVQTEKEAVITITIK